MGTNRAVDMETLKALPHGGECTVHWFEEGGGLVHRLWDVYVLFEVGQYGGTPHHAGTFHERQLDKLLDMAYSWP